jgi:predicted enzyme related to lactoylglutathione lyase
LSPAADAVRGGIMKMKSWWPCAIVLGFVLGMAVQAARGSGSAADTERVTGLGGIFFKSPDPAKLAGWYRDHLGVTLEPAGRGAGAPQFYVFQWRGKDQPDTVGATVFTIFPASSKYFDPTTAPFMINFRVANLERLLAQLKAEGVSVDAKIVDESNGRFAWASDPEGRRIELWEPK